MPKFIIKRTADMQQERDNSLSSQDTQVQARTQQNKSPVKTKQLSTEWTKEMNVNVVRCYYKSIGTSASPTYRKSMHTQWKKRYPGSTVTEQKTMPTRKRKGQDLDEDMEIG